MKRSFENCEINILGYKTYLKHFLIQRIEERGGGVCWAENSFIVINFQISEVFLEHVCVLLVHHAVRPGEHLVEFSLGFV